MCFVRGFVRLLSYFYFFPSRDGQIGLFQIELPDPRPFSFKWTMSITEQVFYMERFPLNVSIPIICWKNIEF